MIRNEIKSRLEIIPFLLVVESFVCFLLSYTDLYQKLFTYWEDLTECSLLMCIIFYALSENWGVVSRKSIITLFILNGVNLVYQYVEKQTYYSLFLSTIFIFYLFLIIRDLCLKK